MIRVQRRDLARHIDRNTSLDPKIPGALSYVYNNAKIEAGAETGLSETSFPAECPWQFEQIMDVGFWLDQQ